MPVSTKVKPAGPRGATATKELLETADVRTLHAYAAKLRRETAAIAEEIQRMDPRTFIVTPLTPPPPPPIAIESAAALTPSLPSPPPSRTPLPTTTTNRVLHPTFLSPIVTSSSTREAATPATANKWRVGGNLPALNRIEIPEAQRIRESIAEIEAHIQATNGVTNGAARTRLTLSQWVPVALQTVERVASHSTSTTPHPLPIALAVHVAAQCFEACGLGATGEALLRRLELGLYAKGATTGTGAKDGVLEHMHSLVSRPTVHASLRAAEASEAAAVTARDKLEALARDAQLEKRMSIRGLERMTLRTHFMAWHGVALRDKAYRWTLRRRIEQRRETIMKARSFYGWRVLIVAGTDSSGQGSAAGSVNLRNSPGMNLIATSAQNSPKNAAMAALNNKRSITFGELPDSMPPPVAPAQQKHRTPGLQSTVSTDPPSSDEADSADEEGEGEDDDFGSFRTERFSDSRRSTPKYGSERKKASLESKYKLAKERYRSAEQTVKQLRADRDRQTNLLAASADCLERASNAILSGRSDKYAVKASDVALNAQKLASGNFGDFISTSITGVDDLKPPVPCKGTHVLLSWANFIIERVTGVNARVGHIAEPFTNGVHYATIISAVFPDSDLPTRMRAIDSIPERMELMVMAVSRLVVDVQKITHAAAALRIDTLRRESLGSRRQSFSSGMPSPGMRSALGLTTALSFRSATSRRSSVSSQQTGMPRSRSAYSFDSEERESDATELQEADYTNTDVGNVGPILAAGVRSADLVAGYEDAHLILLSFLFRSFANTMTLQAYDGDNAIESWMDPSAKVERHVRAVELLSTSFKSWQLLLALVEDACVISLYRLAKGERAGAIFGDIRNDSVLGRFLIPMTVPTAAFKPPEQTLPDQTPDGSESLAESPSSPDEPFSSWGMSEDELRYMGIQQVHNQLTSLIPDAAARREVIQATHLHGEALYGLFSHFAPSSALMPPTGLETLVIECKLVELGVVSRGTGLQLARQHGKTNAVATQKRTAQTSTTGLEPMEFVVAMVHLSEMAAPSLIGKSSATSKTYNTPASRFDFFITQYIQSRVRLSTADAVRRVLQQGPVTATMGQYGKALKTLFGSVAAAAVARAASRSVNGGSGATAAAEVEELSLQMDDWVKLVKDLEMIDAITPVKFVQLIFANSQDSFDATGDADMSYAEFEEAMVALALARVSNPYMTISVRLHVFFSEKLLPQLRRKFPAVFLRIGNVG